MSRSSQIPVAIPLVVGGRRDEILLRSAHQVGPTRHRHGSCAATVDTRTARLQGQHSASMLAVPTPGLCGAPARPSQGCSALLAPHRRPRGPKDRVVAARQEPPVTSSSQRRVLRVPGALRRGVAVAVAVDHLRAHALRESANAHARITRTRAPRLPQSCSARGAQRPKGWYYGHRRGDRDRAGGIVSGRRRAGAPDRTLPWPDPAPPPITASMPRRRAWDSGRSAHRGDTHREQVSDPSPACGGLWTREARVRLPVGWQTRAGPCGPAPTTTGPRPSAAGSRGGTHVVCGRCLRSRALCRDSRV